MNGKMLLTAMNDDVFVDDLVDDLLLELALGIHRELKTGSPFPSNGLNGHSITGKLNYFVCDI